MTITFLSDDRYRKGWLWQTFSRQTKREMLLVTVRSFVCQLVAGLDGEKEREREREKERERERERERLDSKETVRNMTRTGVINRCRSLNLNWSRTMHPGLRTTCRVPWLLRLLALIFGRWKKFRGKLDEPVENRVRIVWTN